MTRFVARQVGIILQVIAFDEFERSCASLLNIVDVAEYEAKLDPRVEGTLEWVMHSREYNHWEPATTLLRVTGYMGCGKTVLTSFIWRYLNEQPPKTLTCRFFCDEKVEEYRNPCVLLKSLIFQIVSQRQRLWRVVRKAAKTRGIEIFDQFDNLWNLFEQLVRAEKKYPIRIIIDAIDELKKNEGERVFARIRQLLSAENTALIKFWITARSNARGVDDPQASLPQMAHLALMDSKENIDNDIRIVVRHRLKRMEKSGICKPSVRNSLEESLLAKADQTFLWITLVLRPLEERRLLFESDLEAMVARLPMTLAKLYQHLLCSIPADDQPTAAKILRFLVLCDRPLTGDEIGIMFTITPDHRSTSSLKPDHLLVGEESVVSLLGPLVRVHGSHIHLVHQSLKDFLTNLPSESQNPLAAMFGVDRLQDKLFVLRACLMYLSLEEFQQNLDTAESTDSSHGGDGKSASHNSTSPHKSASNLFAPSHKSTSDHSTPPHESASNHSTPPYELSLLEGPKSQEDYLAGYLAEDSTWAPVNAKYKLFNYAALHWAKDFATCNEIINEQDNEKAQLIFSNGTAWSTNWLRYFWYIEMHHESFPTVADNLMWACYFGHTSRFARLTQGPEPVDPEALIRALYWAARQGHTACVVAWLQLPDNDAPCSVTKNQEPLLVASQFGHVDCVKILVKDSRVNVNTQDDSGRTALSLAVENNHAETVKALLDCDDLDVNLQDHASKTPLHISIGAASASIVAQLLEDRRVKVDQLDKRGRSILSWAAELGIFEIIPLLLKHLRTSIEHRDFRGRTCLSYAAQHGHLQVVKMLTRKGYADPLGQDENGRNAHSWAAMHRHPEVLRYLLKKFPKGANVKDKDGWTPLAWTLDPPGYRENMRLLLHHSEVNGNHKDGIHIRTILSWVARNEYPQMALEMIESGVADPEARDVNGRTPLSEAAGNGDVKIVGFLIDTGKVDVNSRDRHGQTPLLWAQKGGHEDTVALLLQHHATL